MKKFAPFIFLIFLISCGKEKPQQTSDHVFYTCSMDPQVVEKKPGKCPICKMELTKVEIKKNASNLLKLSKEQELLANIKTARVHESEINQALQFNGNVIINEDQTFKISSRMNGRIEKLYIKTNGEAIEAGTLLYEIYSEELLVAQKEFLIAWKKQKLLPSADLNYTKLAEAAKNKLLLWGMNEKQIHALTQKEVFANRTKIYSKQKGTVTTIFAQEGDYVQEGDAIFAVTDLSSLWVTAEVYASETGAVYTGARATVQIDGFPNKKWESRISFAAPQLQTQSKIDIMRVEIPNSSLLIKPGMHATITVYGNTGKGIVVPLSAVLQDSQGATVWVKKKDGSYENRMIVKGTENADSLLVRMGLEEDEEVVVSGTYLLNSEYILRKGNDPMQGHDMSNM